MNSDTPIIPETPKDPEAIEMPDIPETQKAPEWVRTGKCIRCGKCCTRVATYMQYTEELRDYLEWLSVHDGITVQRDKGTNMAWIEFRTKCKYMKVKKGKVLCKIYAQRPKVCQDFPNSPITGKNCLGFTFSTVDPAEAP